MINRREINNFKSDILVVIVFSIISCTPKSKYSEKENLLLTEDILRIEFKNPIGKACQKDFEEFAITQRELINEFITIINNAKFDGPWKGGGVSNKSI